MSYKISGTEVISDSRKGKFTIANVGSYTPSNRPTTGIAAGDLIYNSDLKILEVYDGSNWLSAGGAQGKSPHATGGNVIQTPTGYTHVFYSSGPIRVKGSSTGSMSFTREMGGGGGGGGTSTGAGGGGGGAWVAHPFELLGQSASWSSYITIGSGGAVNTNGSGTLVTGIPGAGGGGHGGSPGDKPGEPGSDNPGYPNTAGSGGGACSWNTPSSGHPGGSGSPATISYPGVGQPEPVGGNYQQANALVYRYAGGLGKDAWHTSPSWGGYYAGGGGGGAGGNGPGGGGNPGASKPGGSGRNVNFGTTGYQYKCWGGGGGANTAVAPSDGGSGSPNESSKGGSNGEWSSYTNTRQHGEFASGGGGGGAGGPAHPTGGSGGSGVFFISYPYGYRNYADKMN